MIAEKPDAPLKKIKTLCYKCGLGLERTNFDIVLGTFAAFLCKKHAKEVQDILESGV
jgi:hypothetical protein